MADSAASANPVENGRPSSTSNTESQAKDTERLKEYIIPSQMEEGERMSKMRQYLEKTVDRIVSRLNQKDFVTSMPQGLNPEFLVALQSKMCSTMKIQMCQQIEEHLSEIGPKLNALDDIVKNTPHPVSHFAWRPPAENTVENSMLAHDLQVTLKHKEKLESLLKEVDDECSDLTQQVLEAERRLSDNQAVLLNMERSYETFTEKIRQQQE